MKKNKKLERYVEDCLAIYENDEFLEKLKSNVSANKSKMKSKKRLGLVFSCVGVIIIIGICLGVFIGQPWLINDENTTLSPEIPDKKHYSSLDEITEDILIDELNSNIEEIQFNSDGLEYSTRVINTFYNEELLYVLQYNYNETIETVSITICVNEEYGYIFPHKEYNSSTKVQGYDINYVETYEYEDEFYFFETKGEIILESIKIYIEYEGVGEEEISNFLNILDAIII